MWCLMVCEREGLQSFGCLESMDRRFQGCHVQVAGRSHGFGLALGEFDEVELELEPVDLPGQVGRVHASDAGFDVVDLFGSE